MKNINIKNILKRVVAYMIDIVIVTIIASIVANIPLLNKQFNKYQKIYDEFNELYTEYTEMIVNINDYSKDEEITKEEYEKLLESKTYKEIIEEKYEDELLEEDEIEDISKAIDEKYTSLAQDYNYKLQKVGIYNSIITLSCILLYFGIFQFFLKGQTIGKKILSLKVVSINDKKVNILTYLLRSLIVNNVLLNAINLVFLQFSSRNVFNQVDSIISFLVSLVEALIIFLVITREDNRGLHDLVCKTKVISTKEN